MTAETAEALAVIKALIEAGSSPWVSRAGAAAYAHVSVGTIDNLVGEGSLPVGGWIRGLPRFRKRDLDALLESGRIKDRQTLKGEKGRGLVTVVGVDGAGWRARQGPATEAA